MTIIEKPQSKVQTPSPSHRPGTSKGDTRRESRSVDVKGKSGRKDSDLISTATSALRRLNFRSAGGSHPKRATASAPAGQNGSPLQQTSSSTTSETTINTSIESANTVYTMITVTDAEQEEKADQEILESKALAKEGSEGKDQTRRAEKKPEIRSKEILNEFDKLFFENEKILNAEKSKSKAAKNGAKFHQGIGAAAGGGGVGGTKKGTVDQKKPVTTVTIQDKADKGKFKKLDWPLKKGKQSALDDKHTKTTKTSLLRASSLERGSDKTVSSLQQKPAYAPDASPPMSMFPQDQAYFLTPSMIDEDAIQDYDFLDENGKLKENPKEKIEKPKSNIRTIQSELPQRTFSTNFNKRKKVGDLEERRKSQAELDRMPFRDSPTTSPKPKITDDTRFPFPPRSHSPIKLARSSSPRLKREVSTSLRKLSDAPITPITHKNETASKATTHATMFPFTLSNLEHHEMQVSEEVQKFRSNFGRILDVTSPPLEEGYDPAQMTSSGLTVTSPSETDTPLTNNESEGQNGGNFAGPNIKDDGKTFADETTRMSHKRKKRHDRKSTSLETSDEDTKFIKSRNSRDAFLSSLGERNIGSPQSRKYSVLATDGSVKNFVSETSDEFKKSGENVNKENIKKKKTARRSSECPQRHRRVSIIQGESLRHFIFEEPDTSRMKPSKQRKVSKVIEDTTRSLLLEDVHPRKSSLAPGDTTKTSMGEESPRKSSIVPDDKPRKFSINTLGDIVSARKFSLLPPGEIYTSQVDGKTTEVIKLAPVAKGKPLATIVVQQASIQRGSISGPSNQREDSLLDVSNTFTLEELHEFDMKYGSPHHCRSQSVKTPGRSCGRPNYLCLPQQRARVASMPNTGVEEEYYRLRHFSITGKGLVNRGDSLKSRRSRSNTSVASSNSSHSTDHLANNACAVGSYPGSARNSAECSLASSRDSSTTSVPYRVVLLGSDDVGKTSLISQFMTSEYLNAYEASLDEEEEEKSVSVLLDGEESELIFVDHPSSELTLDNGNLHCDAQAYVIVYSVVDRESFQIAEQVLQCLWRNESIGTKAVILVGNKGDLARSRTVTYDEGVDMANAYDCKFIETSVGINHNVDELLVGILSQIRLKLKRAAKPKRNRSPFGRDHSPKRWRNTRLSASLKVRGLLGRVLAREDKDGEMKKYNSYQEEWFHREQNDSDDYEFDDYIDYDVNYDADYDTSAKAKNKKRGKRAFTMKKRGKVGNAKRVRKDKENEREIIFFSLDFDRSFVVKGQTVESFAEFFRLKTFTADDLFGN